MLIKKLCTIVMIYFLCRLLVSYLQVKRGSSGIFSKMWISPYILYKICRKHQVLAILMTVCQ